ncbi:MAG TPA: hypothetical protein VKV77_05210 [Methylovirgula sp.]|nr:hypothetical protein [Methylovirgula sp.]
MTRRRVIAQCVRAHWLAWTAMSVGLFLAYYLAQIVILYLRLGHLPNYIALYDYPANIVGIVRSTPAVSDMIPIILNEWLLEIGYMNYEYGHGIAEWTLALLPAKLVLIAISAILVSTNVLLLRRARVSCSFAKRRFGAGATGVGALTFGLANISLSWVVCCAAPNWVVGLTLLGLDSTLSFTLEPLGPWIALAGIALLVGSMFSLAGRQSRMLETALRRETALEAA